MRQRSVVELRKTGRRRAHGSWRLDDGLSLVFKPQGHSEAAHQHPYPIRLRVLRGCLWVCTEQGKHMLRNAARALAIPAGAWHSTWAVVDTWLVVELTGSMKEAQAESG